jgi:hypothetical protein
LNQEDIDRVDTVNMTELAMGAHKGMTEACYLGLTDDFSCQTLSIAAWILRQAGVLTDEGPKFQGFAHLEKYPDLRQGLLLIAKAERNGSQES